MHLVRQGQITLVDHVLGMQGPWKCALLHHKSGKGGLCLCLLFYFSFSLQLNPADAFKTLPDILRITAPRNPHSPPLYPMFGFIFLLEIWRPDPTSSYESAAVEA